MRNNEISADEVKLVLGKRIRKLRKKLKLTILNLAELTDLTSSTISQIERGLISPSIATLKKICDAMHIPISYLFEDIGAKGESDITPLLPLQADSSILNDMEAYIKSLPKTELGGASPVVHRKDRKFLSPGEGIRFYLLNPNLSGPIAFIYNEYDPGRGTGPTLYSHTGSECGLILSGELVVQIKDKVYTLKEGDSITFNSSDPHLKRNDSDEVCTCIWANVPPWF